MEEKITITLEEYKKLLETKGKYEELKAQTTKNSFTQVREVVNEPYTLKRPDVTF